MKKIIIPLLLVANIAFAAIEPIPLASDARIRIVAYSANNVIPLYERPLTTTQIIFADNQTVLDTQGGDAGGWSPYWDKAVPNVLNLKLTAQESDSNMTVITESTDHEKFFYYFHLQSTGQEGQATYALRFVYPEEDAKALKKKVAIESQQTAALVSAFQHPEHYQWDYSFHGDKTIVPLHVFDDGTFTYFQLQPNQPVPAVFAVDNKQAEEAVVNVRQKGEYLVVQRIAPQFTLRVGERHVASIFNNTKIKQLRG